MKKIIGYLGTYLFYNLGVLIYFIIVQNDWLWLYPVYGNIMELSKNIQIWANLNRPWIKLKKK